jgi:2,4-dienoyl-CoA reductase-like NADH-dependent reductase (Old Yellow Enzyme family)
MKNRFMLAPLTNSQSHADGRLSDEEHHWLTLRAKGGFGSTMTCAAHVQAVGQGFPGQLGVFGDQHVAPIKPLAQTINSAGSVSIVQLHHAGNRSPKDLIGTDPVCPSDDPSTGARALTGAEVHRLIGDFIAAAKRVADAGFHGVELHGAHGYILCQFLSGEINRRTDPFGGSLANRSRILFDIIKGIRQVCRPDFIVGVRLSPERFGMRLAEVRELSQQLIDTGDVDFLDLSLWDTFKLPEEKEFKTKPLISWFDDLSRKGVPVGVAGKIHDPADAERALGMGADFVLLGRVAILHHDYPLRYAADAAFKPVRPPVTRAWLAAEGLSPPFIGYMAGWKGFIAD